MSTEAGSAAAIAARLSVERASRVTLATQIARQLTWLIATGAIAAGSHLPTLHTLAAQLGVNVHTVRAAYQQLSDDGLVVTRRGSGTAVLGYDQERALNHQPSFTVGILIPAFSDYYADYLDSITVAAAAEGWLPIICQTRNYNSDVVSRYLDQLFSRSVDGVVVTHFETADDLDTVRILRSAAALRPLVFVDSAPVDAGSMITVDRESDGFVATKHLIDHGHSRVGYLAPPRHWSATERLRRGYDQALLEAGIAVDERHVCYTTEFSLDAGIKAAGDLLHRSDPPTAIFGAGDILALGAMSAAHAYGFRIPEDVSLMGYGELPLSALSAPALASIRLPATDLAISAITTLRRAIDQGRDQPAVEIATSIDPRASCGCRGNEDRSITPQEETADIPPHGRNAR